MYSKHKWLTFYRKLGFLLYSVAAVDKQVSPAEIDTLKREIQKNWLDFEDTADAFGSDAAFQIASVFDWLNNESYAAADAFREFEDFVRENPDFINQPAIKDRILFSANRIAFAFYGNNKKELTLLHQLERLLSGTV